MIQEKTKEAKELAKKYIEQGYRSVSNKHKSISKIDRPDWKEFMAKEHASWDPEGEGMNWVISLGSLGAADYYRRIYSKDKIEGVSCEVFKHIKLLQYFDYNSVSSIEYIDTKRIRKNNNIVKEKISIKKELIDKCIDDLKKLKGLPPYNVWSNLSCNDPYFAKSIKGKYDKIIIIEAERILAENKSKAIDQVKNIINKKNKIEENFNLNIEMKL